MPDVYYLDNPNSVRSFLESTPWGTTQIGLVHFIGCPVCLANIPAAFTNAHELPANVTPKSMHTQYHVNIAHALYARNNPTQ